MTRLPELETRYVDDLSDWTTAVEEAYRCDGCLKGVWMEDTEEVPGQMPGDHYCEDCAFQVKKEYAMAMAR